MPNRKHVSPLLKTHIILMVFFLTGYVIVGLALFFNLPIFSEIFVGLIFMFGAVFVMLGIIIQNIMITEINQYFSIRIKIEKLESIGVLAGGIAHDFNNILTGILGNVTLAKTYVKNKDELLFDILKDIENASQRSKTLTAQLLAFAKGGIPIKRVTNIGELTKDTVKFILRGSNVASSITIPEDLWLAEVDGEQISQSINNLIINANQAMPEGGVMEVTAENTAVSPGKGFPVFMEDGKYVKITIRDHGHGIENNTLDKIFDPYFTTKQKASGLGLTTAYYIIKNHNGYITVASDIGKGSTFCIYLPASEKETVTGQIEELNIFTGRGKILIMDDNDTVRKTIGKMLTKLGYTVELSKEGSETIELYEKAKKQNQGFDAVVMDLTIPGGIGGKEAVKRLLEIDPKAKVIVSSGYSDDPIISKHKEYGFTDVVTKPYTLEKLSEVLHKVLKRNIP